MKIILKISTLKNVNKNLSKWHFLPLKTTKNVKKSIKNFKKHLYI